MKRFLHVVGVLALTSFAMSAPAAGCCCSGGCQGGMGQGKGMMMGRGMGGGCCRAGQEMAPTAAGEKPKGDSAAKRHPLRGVIVAVHADTSELRVKHEAIPGVMRAMTMMFKVDPATIQTAKAGQTITAQMSREDGNWWLHDVKVVSEAR